MSRLAFHHGLKIGSAASLIRVVNWLLFVNNEWVGLTRVDTMIAGGDIGPDKVALGRLRVARHRGLSQLAPHGHEAGGVEEIALRVNCQQQ